MGYKANFRNVIFKCIALLTMFLYHFPHSEIFFLSCRVFGIVLIFVDIALLIVDLAVSDTQRNTKQTLEGVSLGIALFFFVDVHLRVFVEG